LHVEAGPTYGGSTGILEGYLLYGDRERIVRDVLFHYRVPGSDTIEQNCRRFICLDRRPPKNWDMADESGRSGKARVGPASGGMPPRRIAEATGAQGEAVSAPATPGAVRRTAKKVPGARALARIARAVARLVAVELPLAFRVAVEARRGRYDLIHSNNTPTIQRSTIIASVLAGKPVVAHVRTSVKLGWFDRQMTRRCRLVIAQSSSVEKELREQNLPAPIVSCFDGVPIPSEPSQVSSDVKGELLGTADTVIGGVGRHVERKGFRYLIEAMPAVLERHSQVTLALVGDGPQRKELEDLAASLGIGNKVRFLGFRRDIRYVLQSIDIFAVPSLREGLPLTMLEAMAEGRPTVASAVDGIPTFVHHESTGLLVSPMDPPGLAKALIRLLSDRSLAAELGRAGRALAAREASVKKTAARVDELLLGALEGRRGG
jgi:glycosyltransferase involved in cell wall biosynthesis